jgi:hypothetical protein
MRLRACAAPVLIGLAFFVGCAKKRDAADVATQCDHMLLRLRGWDGRLDDPQLDCPRLKTIAQEAVAFTKAMHQTALSKGGQGEALSMAVDLESSTAAWAAEVAKCQATDDFDATAALVRTTHDKVRAAVTADRDRVQARCGGRGAAK